jgi:hypothetical protein
MVIHKNLTNAGIFATIITGLLSFETKPSFSPSKPEFDSSGVSGLF